MTNGINNEWWHVQYFLVVVVVVVGDGGGGGGGDGVIMVINSLVYKTHNTLKAQLTFEAWRTSLNMVTSLNLNCWILHQALFRLNNVV